MDAFLARLNDSLKGVKTPERTQYVTKEPFNIDVYESLPLAEKNAYAARTKLKFPKKDKDEESFDVVGTLKNKAAVQDEVDTKASNIYRAFSPDPVSDFTPEQPVEEPAREPASDSMDWSGFIPALASLGTEALMGSGGGPTQGESLGISSKFLLDNEADKAKQRRTLEEALRKAKQDRDLAAYKASLKASTPDKGRKRYAQVRLIDDKTKKTILANHDTFTGEYLLPSGKKLSGDMVEAGYSVTPYVFTDQLAQKEGKEIRVGEHFGRGTTTDPNTGLKARIINGKMVPIQPQSGKLNPKLEKDLTAITKQFLSTDLYKKTSQTLSYATNINNLMQAVNTGNATAANMARGSIARMSGEVGAMSDDDIERAGGSTAIKEQARRFAMLQKTGVPLSDRDQAEIRQIAVIYTRDARRKLAEATANMEADFIQNYGGVKGAVGTKMKTFTPSSPTQAAPKKPTFEEWKKLKGL